MMTVLPTPAPPKMPILPPLRKRRDQVDHLDARLELLGRHGLVDQGWRGTMDRVVRVRVDFALAVDWLTQHVEEAAQATPDRPAP